MPSLTLVTTRGVVAGGPDIEAPFSALKADCELTSGNPAADRGPVGKLDGAVMSSGFIGRLGGVVGEAKGRCVDVVAVDQDEWPRGRIDWEVGPRRQGCRGRPTGGWSEANDWAAAPEESAVRVAQQTATPNPIFAIFRSTAPPASV